MHDDEDFDMDRETLRQVQLDQLEIAKDIKRVCEENGIRYHLAFGSLLGAVRHKGFIPWDDDMDFGMLREDYERFLEIAPKKLKDEFFLQTWHTDPYYPLAFAKVRKKGTVFQEAAMINCQAHNELYVDVFPFDNFPDDERSRRKQKRKIMLYRFAILTKRKSAPWLNHSNPIERLLVRLKYLPAILFSYFHNTEDMISRMEQVMVEYNNSKTSHYYHQGTSNYGKVPISSDCLDEYVQIPFEDTTFLAPAGYEKYLTEVYGNYMELPPEDKREPQHHIIELKL